MRKISLIRVPPIINLSNSASPICPPIGLAYLNAVIDRKLWDVHVVDSVGNYPKFRNVSMGSKTCSIFGESAEEIVDSLPTNVNLVLISIMFSQDWPYAYYLIKKIKEKLTEAKIIAGGEHISALPEFTLMQHSEIDCCVIGEGEETLGDILSGYLAEGRILSDISGTYVRGQNGQLIKNPTRQRIRKIDSILWPKWDDFPLENYFKGEHSFGVYLDKTMPLLASRGCPYQCTFCSSPSMWTTTWLPRDPQDVIKEIQFYKKKYGVTNFDFYDLTAIVKKSWIVNFTKRVISEKMNITWQLPSGTRSEAIDEEVAPLLYESGCRNLSYAPESGSERVLKMIKKKIKVDRMLRSMKACNRANLSVKANILCGFPGETIMDLWKTYVFIIKMSLIGVDDMSINQFTAYPGTELYDQLRQEGKVQLNDQYFESLSFYSSMTDAQDMASDLSKFTIIFYKFFGIASFYAVSFVVHPKKILRTIKNVAKGIETTRLEKVLLSYISKVEAKFSTFRLNRS